MATLNFVAADAAIKELLSMNQEDPSELEIWNYITTLHRTLLASGQQCLCPEEFYKPNNVAIWKAAWEERPKDKAIPPEADLLPIAKLLNAALIPFSDGQGKMVSTFRERVEHARGVLVAWLRKNETPNERRARVNREVQERYRNRKKGDPQALAVKQAYDKYLEACRQHKEAEAKWKAYLKDLLDNYVKLRDSGPT